MQLALCTVWLGIAMPVAGGARETGNLACSAWGGSHTSRYTFSIDRKTCRTHWLEIDRELEILTCDPPRIVAKKPFAPADGYELRFNLDTGAFSDHVPGWAEYGACKPGE